MFYVKVFQQISSSYLSLPVISIIRVLFQSLEELALLAHTYVALVNSGFSDL